MFEVKSMAGIPSLMSKSVTSFLAALPNHSADHDTTPLSYFLAKKQKKHGGSWSHIKWQIMAAYLDMVAISYYRWL